MNDLFGLLGIETWKPVLTALLLPPVPLLLMVLVGARLILPRRGWGWLLVVVAVVLLWLSSCSGAARLMSSYAVRSPPPLDAAAIAAIRAEVRARRAVAIVVLGGGMEPYAPEYGVASLSSRSLERLRYGIWLARQTGAPVAFSGGIGWGASVGSPEAQVASRIAAEEFAYPLRWTEDASRDTRENAGRTLALLRPAGIDHIVLVTHGWHMPRAQRAFEAAAGAAVRVQAAPMGLARNTETSALAWMPSTTGYAEVRAALREWLGRLAGA